MSTMNETPRSGRLHIGIFGKRNAGKSSLLNAITNQDAAVVSSIKGTTTDPVFKAMELLPIGPVVFIDTPGIDDEGQLGELRTKKARKILRQTDVALLVVDSAVGLAGEDKELLGTFEKMHLPHLIVYNKSDLLGADNQSGNDIRVSASTGENIPQLKERIAQLGRQKEDSRRLVADMLAPGDVVLVVVPIDKAAPKGRLILPQQQVLRDILDADAISVVVDPARVSDVLGKLSLPPKLVITDSQAFNEVSKVTPKSVGLTSFSILMARYKGVLDQAVAGAEAIDSLKDSDKVLVCEACTHNRQCGDIGTVKIPAWIKKRTGATPTYEFTSGGDFPDELSGFNLVIHCGGCMLGSREIAYRHHAAAEASLPITNYGVAISHMHGILQRCIAPMYS